MMLIITSCRISPPTWQALRTLSLSRQLILLRSHMDIIFHNDLRSLVYQQFIHVFLFGLLCIQYYKAPLSSYSLMCILQFLLLFLRYLNVPLLAIFTYNTPHKNVGFHSNDQCSSSRSCVTIQRTRETVLICPAVTGRIEKK